MSATYFETVQRQTAQRKRSADLKLPPGVGLVIAAISSLTMWLLIGSAVLNLIT
jgi:hypothetical protein